MTTQSTNDIISTVTSNTPYEVTVLDGKPYLRYDFYSTVMNEAEDDYYIIVEELEKLGIEFDDPCIEHDCITGNLKWTDNAAMVPFTGDPALDYCTEITAIAYGTALINGMWMYQVTCVEGTTWCVEWDHLQKNRPVYSPYTGQLCEMVTSMGAMRSRLPWHVTDQ